MYFDKWMGFGASKNDETNNIQAVEDMDEDELRDKDKMLKTAIVALHGEITIHSNWIR